MPVWGGGCVTILERVAGVFRDSGLQRTKSVCFMQDLVWAHSPPSIALLFSPPSLAPWPLLNLVLLSFACHCLCVCFLSNLTATPGASPCLQSWGRPKVRKSSCFYLHVDQSPRTLPVQTRQKPMLLVLMWQPQQFMRELRRRMHN